MIKKLGKKFGRWAFRTLAFIGLMTITINLGIFIYAYKMANKSSELPSNMVLNITIDGALAAMPSNSPLDQLLGDKKQNLFTLTNTIKKAATDDRVQGLIADISMASVSSAEAKDLHDALTIFRKSGKFSVAYADTFSEGGNALSQYYLASGFDEIWMQPSGTLFLVGLAAEVPFFKDTFAKLGIQPDFVKFTEWKSGPNIFTQSSFTPEHQQTMQDIVNGVFEIVTTGIQANRKALSSVDESLFLDGPYTGEQTLKLNLIDKTAYKKELLDWALSKVAVETTDKEEKLTPLEQRKKYLVAISNYTFKGDKLSGEQKENELAIVFAAGQILRGKTEVPSPLGGGNDAEVRANSLANSIYLAAEEKKTKAIVLRVDSPGGSYVASDTIRKAILFAKSKNIPVIASMGRLAASGGYYISMDADKIFAQPSTLTGSIGVYGGKFAVEDLADKWDVKFDRVVKGDKATMLSATEPFSPVQRTALEDNMKTVFADFSDKATKARPQLDTSVDGILGGRVFTGVVAQRNGLIDELGGLQDAIKYAKTAAGLDADKLYPVVLYPKKKSPQEALRALLTGNISVPVLPINMKSLQRWLGHNTLNVNDAAIAQAPVL